MVEYDLIHTFVTGDGASGVFLPPSRNLAFSI